MAGNEKDLVSFLSPEALHIVILRAYDLCITGLHIIHSQTGPLLIYDPLSVGPERKLVKDLVILFVLPCLQGLFLLFPFHMGKIRFVVVILHSQDQLCSGKLHFCHLIRNRKGKLGLSAVNADLIKAGPVLSVLYLFRILLLSVRGEKKRFIIQPDKGAFLFPTGELSRFFALCVMDPEAGIVCIILFVGIYYRNGSMLSVGRSGDPCGVIVERKVIDSDLFHILVSFFK